MKYDDDQCERCGGARVAKSTLCADCLVKRLNAEMKEMLIKHVVIDMLRVKLETQTGRLQDALNYGFRKNQENSNLRLRIMEIEREIEGGINNGKDRI